MSLGFCNINNIVSANLHGLHILSPIGLIYPVAVDLDPACIICDADSQGCCLRAGHGLLLHGILSPIQKTKRQPLQQCGKSNLEAQHAT